MAGKKGRGKKNRSKKHGNSDQQSPTPSEKEGDRRASASETETEQIITPTSSTGIPSGYENVKSTSPAGAPMDLHFAPSSAVCSATLDALPTHISVFYPSDRTAYSNAVNASWFSRIHFSGSVTVLRVLANRTSALKQTFCMIHRNVVLIFSESLSQHQGQIKLATNMITKSGRGYDAEKSVLHVGSAEKAGFRFETLGDHVALMVVDLGVTKSEG